MADTVTVSRKHHSGLDADKTGITGAIGETYGATDSGKLYYWNTSLSAWKTGLGYEFVERLVNVPDKQVGDFTCDGNWHVDGLDLSAIVPVGAVAVKLRLIVNDDAAASELSIKRDAAHAENLIKCKTYVANIASQKVEDISIDANLLLDYSCTNVVFITINLTVLGWYI